MNRLQLRTTLNVKLSQRLTLTPALLQKIELLTLNQLELAERLKQELSENPVLEEAGEIETGSETPEPGSEEEEQSDEDPFSDIDVDYFFEDYLPPPARIRCEPNRLEDKPSFESFLSNPVTLQDHLNWQLNLTEVKPEIQRIAYFMIGNINADGYLCVSSEEIRHQLDASSANFDEALRIIQSFDPVGVCARDLKECLLIQLEALGLDSGVSGKLVRDHLSDIREGSLHKLPGWIKCTSAEINEALKVIRALSPKPGQRYNSSRPALIQPDVYIQTHKDGYRVVVSDGELPQLRLSYAYRRLLRDKTTSKEDKSYIRERFRSAVELLKSVDQREATIYRVCESLIRRQRPFLDHGLLHLRPLLIKEVAEELKLHSSTISRVVANKYAHTPQGVLELRRFFNIGVEGSGGQTFSTVQVKETMRKIFGSEDSSKPLSDQKIADRLNREGIQITRRTVAKYRDQMNIVGSRQRYTRV